MSLKRNFDGFCWELFQDDSNTFKWKKVSTENEEDLVVSEQGFRRKKECIADAEKAGCPPRVAIFWKTTPFS
ncbi:MULTISPECIES: hypothetical protein [unclassified Carboxylicivirga]|uniref:hypothetical protein n=1 Tax=Carboxylicivirga TaxID=1628153 RepID=UPI003D34EA0B